MDVFYAQRGRQAENYNPFEQLAGRLMVVSPKDNEVLIEPYIKEATTVSAG